jgi:hypothetical protein
VSCDAIVEAHADAVFTALDGTIARGSYDQQNTADLPNGFASSERAVVCLGSRGYTLQTAVNAKQGVILDVEVTTWGCP